MIWMSAPTAELCRQNAFTHGPAPWSQFHPDEGDFIVGKSRDGQVIVFETWDGVAVPEEVENGLG